MTIYAAQILITMIAIAMLASRQRSHHNPLLLEWHNAAAVFYDPVPTHIGLALITHQLGYFDILPLYVVLMLMAPGVRAVGPLCRRTLYCRCRLLIYCVTLDFTSRCRPGRSKASGSSIRLPGS